MWAIRRSYALSPVDINYPMQMSADQYLFSTVLSNSNHVAYFTTSSQLIKLYHATVSLPQSDNFNRQINSYGCNFMSGLLLAMCID